MSNQKKKKQQSPAERQAEIQSARLFGKHVSKEKAYLLLGMTLVACALPMILGIRLWDDIPEIVETGLIGTDGKDDSLPRAAVVFAIPGLLCVLNLIAHIQLLVNQKRMTLPKPHIRLVGRWGFPVISVLFASGMILQSAGSDLTLSFLTPCILGLALMMLGAHMWDCPQDARISLRFSFAGSNVSAWREVHRFAGAFWLAAGLLVIAAAMVTGGSDEKMLILILVALVIPVLYSAYRGRAGLTE